MALRESQRSTPRYSHGDQLPSSHGRSISETPDFRFSEDDMSANAPCQGQSSTYTSTSNSYEENALSISLYSHSDQLSFPHARSITRARALDFNFSEDCTAANVPCHGPSIAYASTSDASKKMRCLFLQMQRICCLIIRRSIK